MWSLWSSVVFFLITVCPGTLQKTLTSQRADSQYGEISRPGGSMVFPDSAGRRSNRALSTGNRLKSPSCPDHQQFCEDVDDYPLEQIRALLKKQPKILLDQFIVDELSSPGGVDKFAPDIDTNICASEETIEYPKKLKTQGVSEFIVNTDDHMQGVRIERCINPGQCNIPGSMPLGYTSHCVQKTITRALVVFNKNGSGFLSKPFEIPSCCSCVIRLEMARFGRPFDDTRTQQRQNVTPRNTTMALKHP